MKRIKIVVQYLGTNYAGWQIQKNGNTIEEEIEKAIFKALKEHCEVIGSGRTDAGVHAIGQIAHFDTNTKIKPEKLCFVINEFLPKDIRILNSEEVSNSFHARFNAKRKTYQYNFYCSRINLPFYDLNFSQVPFKFDILKAQSVLNHFVGTHDFKAFCGSKTTVLDTTRTIYSIKLWQTGECTFCLEVCGNGFLYNMVRIIAGTLIDVGCGKINPKQIPEIINKKNRKLAGKTAPANGLVLKRVKYRKV